MKENTLYQEKLLEYYHYPRNKGKLLDADMTSGVYNPSCGDSVIIQAHVKNDVLKEAVFEGRGCVISQASASMLMERVIGLSLKEAKKISPEDMKKMVGIVLGPTRMRCALIALEALQEAIKEYEQKGMNNA